MRIFVIDKCIRQTTPTLLTTPPKKPQKHLDNPSFLISMQSTIAKPWVHRIDNDLVRINRVRQLPCPQHIQKLRGIIPLHLYSEALRLFHSREDVGGSSFAERDQEMALGGDDGHSAGYPSFTRSLLENWKKEKGKEGGTQMIDLQIQFMTRFRSRILHLLHSGVEKHIMETSPHSRNIRCEGDYTVVILVVQIQYFELAVWIRVCDGFFQILAFQGGAVAHADDQTGWVVRHELASCFIAKRAGRACDENCFVA